MFVTLKKPRKICMILPDKTRDWAMVEAGCHEVVRVPNPVRSLMLTQDPDKAGLYKSPWLVLKGPLPDRMLGMAEGWWRHAQNGYIMTSRWHDQYGRVTDFGDDAITIEETPDEAAEGWWRHDQPGVPEYFKVNLIRIVTWGAARLVHNLVRSLQCLPTRLRELVRGNNNTDVEAGADSEPSVS